MADTWVAAELKLYDMPEAGGHRVMRGKPAVAALRSSVHELERRFGAVTVEEDEVNPATDDSCPYVLVALGVKQTWVPPPSLMKMRFVVLPVSPKVVGADVDPTALFITCMPGKEHGAADGFIHDDIGGWLDRNSLRPFLGQCTNSSHAAGSKMPDTRLDPMYPAPGPPLDNDGGVPFSRLIVEVEYAHRGADELRRIGQHYLNDHYCRAFLAVKIWKKGAGGFGAVAALWLKDAAGNVALDQAFDFGTKPIGQDTRKAWAKPLAAPTHLPAVPVAGAGWFVRPMPVPAAPAIWGGGGPAGPPSGGALTVPAGTLLSEVYDQATPPNRVHLPAGHDLVINLHAYQKLLDTRL